MSVHESALHPYSEVRVCPDGVAYASGVLPYAADGAIVTDETTAPEIVLQLLDVRLRAVGMSLADVVKTTVFVTDMTWRNAVNQAYLAAFSSPMPARTMVEVRDLPQGAPIEIEAVAKRGICG